MLGKGLMAMLMMKAQRPEMNSDLHVQMRTSDYYILSVTGLLFLFQLLLLFFFFNAGLNVILLGVGWILLIPTFLLLTLSANILRRYGNAVEGKSRFHTTSLVNRGAYAIIRHPLYLGWIMMSLALVLVSQYWLSAFFSGIMIPLVLTEIQREDKFNEIKFGQEYCQYQQDIPMLNVFAGLWRYYARRERRQPLQS